MPLSWPQIHVLEISEDYPAAIDALEERLRADPAETEAVIRLGFNLWYAVEENARMEKDLPVDDYARRFMELFHQYRHALIDNADFCWAFGLGMELFWYNFPGATEELGKSLLENAGKRDSFWSRFEKCACSAAEMEAHFKGRGIFQSYYNVQP
jgi:hypothetical protein